MAPRFIGFEGGEGAGKSTQIRLLAERLQAQGYSVTATREPGGTAAGAALRALLLTRDTYAWTAAAETLLMIADRAQHLDEVIDPALARGEIVLTDRYVYSTLAYQGAGRGIDSLLIRDLHARACHDRWPDLTFVLDIEPSLGLQRSQRRHQAQGGGETRFEELDVAFHQRVRESFVSLAAEDERVVLIDASRSAAEVAADIAKRVDSWRP